MKKLMCMLLALTMVFAMAVPAFAADPAEVDLVEMAKNYGQPIHVTIWGKDSIGDDASSRGFLIDQLAKEYAAQFENVTIEYTYQGGYEDVFQKIMQAATAHDLPTAFVTEEAMVRSFATIADKLADYVPADVIANYSQGLLVSMKDDEGNLLAAPYARSLPVLYANKEILEQAGWKIEDINTNDDLFQAAKDVKEKTGAYGLICFWDTDVWHWEGAVYADGGSILSADGSAPTFGKDFDYIGAKYLKKIQDGINAGYVFSPYGTPKPGDTRDDALAKGEAAMGIISSNSMPKRANKMAENGYTLVTRVQPAGEGGISMPSGGSNFVICKDASYEEKMIMGGFLAYLASDENVVLMTENCGNMLITESSKTCEAGQKLLAEKPYFQAIYDSVPYLHERPNTTYWTEMNVYAADKLAQFTLDAATADAEKLMDEIEAKFAQIIEDNAW